MLYIGIDPGANGAIAFLGDIQDSLNFNKYTMHDVAEYLRNLQGEKIALIEQVHSMPKQGVASSFNFGKSFGQIIGVLTALNIPFDYVTPQKWQKSLGCRTGGDKNVTKRKAQQLFPNIKITHANADAFLIAEYCRRIKK